jgi:hypothetical protein
MACVSALRETDAGTAKEKAPAATGAGIEMVRTTSQRSGDESRSSSRKTPERVPDVPPEITSSGWNFGEHHKRAFSDIGEDPNARTSFKNLTSCAKPISKSRLLLELVFEAEAWIGHRMTDKGAIVSGRWDGWEKWSDKWKGLHAMAKSLKGLASKIEKHIALSERGPVALPVMVGEPGEVERYTASHMANPRLKAIAAQLRENAAEIEGFWNSRQEWLKKLPRKNRGNLIERERLVMFMRFVEHETGEPHYEDIANLLSTVRESIANSNAVPFEPDRDQLSSDMLRKLSKRPSTPLVERIYPKR